MTDPNLAHTVGFFQVVFTVIMSLALGEALKQFVADVDDRFIHWDRLPALLTFLLIIFPFFQGMSQHLYLHYLHASPPPKAYAGYLTIDGLVFLFEAACFFAMSRALPARHWRRLFASVLVLMIIDTLWGLFCLWRGIPVDAWIYLNLALSAVIAITWLFERNARASALRPSLILMATVLVTTAISYWTMWDIYFPK